VIARIKRALRHAIERQGYVVRPLSFFGTMLSADLARLLHNRDLPVMLDVGANAGQWMTSIKHAFPQARITCYEPDERAFVQLQAAARSFDDVEAIRCALGPEPGSMKLYRHADSVTSSLLPATTPSASLPYAEKLQPLDSVEVEVRTVDQEVRRLGINHLDVLKTDCQGFDLRVLEGARETIERGDIDLISTEALFHLEYDGQAWFHHVMQWMLARRYSLVGIYDPMHDGRGKMLFADALFARFA
jgi:FkbM family methyltransferase